MAAPQPLQTTRTPIDGTVFVERTLSDIAAARELLQHHKRAEPGWRGLPLEARVDLVERFLEELLGESEAIAEELTWQMGRPISQAIHEMKGVEERGRAMLSMAPDALRDLTPPIRPGFRRYVQREAHGCVLVLCPWNYPYLTAINTVVPALIAGNTVVLKHSLV